MRRYRRFRSALIVYIFLLLIAVLFFRTFRYQYFGPNLCLDRLTGQVYRYNPAKGTWEPEQSVDYGSVKVLNEFAGSLANQVARQQRKPSSPQRP